MLTPTTDSNPNVLYLTSQNDMSTFIQKISTSPKLENLMPINFLSSKDNIIFPSFMKANVMH